MTFCNCLSGLALQVVTATLLAVPPRDLVLEKLKAADVKPHELATALGLTPPMGSLMLRGKRGIPTWHLPKIASLLRVSLSELFAEEIETKAYVPVPKQHKRAGVGVQNAELDHGSTLAELCRHGGPPTEDLALGSVPETATALQLLNRLARADHHLQFLRQALVARSVADPVVHQAQRDRNHPMVRGQRTRQGRRR